MNFSELMKKYAGICIPRLQRDYAQGRMDPLSSDIRNELLSDIFTKDDISLNIIFGDCREGSSGNEFIPIDGQQRLTTVFLLYLYREKMTGIKGPDLKKFSYETRRSTLDFINQIVSRPWPVAEINTTGCVSNVIKNQLWFVWPWNQDPTVSGMLTMLDAIHSQAQQYPFPDLDKITFDFLDMGKMGLNESLYLKMNSRGKHLTTFEKIKSGLDGLLDDVNLNYKSDNSEKSKNCDIHPKSFADYWRWEMDRTWSEWFWDPETKDGDSIFLNLILAFAKGFHMCFGDIPVNARNEYQEDTILKAFMDTDHLSWSNLRRVMERQADRNKPEIKDTLRDNFFEKFGELLKRLTPTDGVFKSSWGDSLNLKHLDSNWATIALVWALVCYNGDNFKDETFGKWLRFAFNMVSNNIDGFDSAVRFIRRCSSHYSANSSRIYDWLVSDEESGKVDDRSEQWEEEREKAKGIKYGNLETLINEAEKHRLLMGRLRPLMLSSRLTISYHNLHDRWEVFKIYFDDEKAIDAPSTFRIFFSYCSIDNLWWNKYVFKNTYDVWKNTLFSQRAFYLPIYHLLNGDAVCITPGKDIEVLITSGILEKVLNLNADFYIRHPDKALRPYNDKWNGIRLYQDHIQASVKTLLEVEGLDFKDDFTKELYAQTGLIWGVRVEFIYKGHNLQLWDNCDLWLPDNERWLQNAEGSNIKIYDFNGDIQSTLESIIF